MYVGLFANPGSPGPRSDLAVIDATVDQIPRVDQAGFAAEKIRAFEDMGVHHIRCSMLPGLGGPPGTQAEFARSFDLFLEEVLPRLDPQMPPGLPQCEAGAGSLARRGAHRRA